MTDTHTFNRVVPVDKPRPPLTPDSACATCGVPFRRHGPTTEELARWTVKA